VETVQEKESIAKEIRTALRHTTVYGLTSILSKAAGFLMLPFYTHYLSPSDYGIIEILDLSITLFGMFLNMGMTVAILRRYAAAESVEEKQKVISTAFLFVAVTGAVIFILGLWLVRPMSAHLLGPHVPSTYLLLSFSSFALLYMTSVPGTYLRALELSGTILIVQTLGTVFVLVLNVYFISVLRMGVLGILWSSVLMAAVQMLLLCGWVVWKVGIKFSTSHLHQMLTYGWPLTFSNLAVFALNFSDRFFLQHLRSLDVVGIYAVGYKFGFMMNFLLVAPFAMMWQARMYNLYAQADHRRIFSRIFVLYSLVLMYSALVLSVLGPEIIRVMVGPKFSASQQVIPLVAFAYVFWGIGFYAQLGMYLTNKTNLIGIVGTGAAVLNIVLNYFLILRYGMLGAAWATLLSFLAIAVANYLLSQRVLPLPLALSRVAAALALCVGFALLPRWWNPQSLGVALLEKGSILAVFPVLVCKAGILSHAEMGTVVSILDTVRATFSRTFGLVPQAE
jgi:O-antigen/teichoic acid export membrane protein